MFTVLLAFNNQKSPKSLIVAHYLLSLLTYFSLNATTELQTSADSRKAEAESDDAEDDYGYDELYNGAGSTHSNQLKIQAMNITLQTATKP